MIKITKKNLIVFGGVGLCVFVIIIWLNVQIGKSIDDYYFKDDIKSDLIDEKKLNKRVVKPQKFRIEITDSDRKNTDQAFWDYRIKKSIKKLNIDEKLDDNNAFTGRLKSKQQYSERLARIDQRIATYQEMLKQNPHDQSTKEHLNNLFQMRSVVVNLESVLLDGAKTNHE